MFTLSNRTLRSCACLCLYCVHVWIVNTSAAPVQSWRVAALGFAPPVISIRSAPPVPKRTRREMPRSNSAPRRKQADKFGSLEYRSHDELTLS